MYCTHRFMVRSVFVCRVVAVSQILCKSRVQDQLLANRVPG